MLDKVTSPPNTKTASAAEKTRLSSVLSPVRWFCSRFSRPFTQEAVTQRLPDNADKLGWQGLQRAFDAVGLKTSIEKIRLDRINPIVLPCLLLGRDGDAIILNRFSENRKGCEIISFAEGDEVRALTRKELVKLITDEVMLVTLDADVLTSLRDSSANLEDTAKAHWFWKPVRDHWSAWMQIVVAAVCINLLALALPIFVMNVYDRVIPSLAFVTLWTLAAGVAIALFLDLILKLVRTNVLERAGRRIDLKLSSSIFKHAMNIRLLNRTGGAATVASQIRDFEAVRDFFTSSSFVAIIDFCFIGLFITVLWMIVGPIAIVPLLAVPVVIIMALIAQVPIGASIERMQQLSGKKQLVLTETLLGIETVKSVNGEPVMQREWENAVAASSRISTKTRFWSNFAISGTTFVQQGVSVLIILWGVYLVSEGRITIGGLIAANILAGRVLAPLANISQTLVRAQQAMRSMRATSEYMDLPTENNSRIGSGLTVREGRINVRDITLTYPGTQVAAISDFNLSIEPGETIGVLGRVGSGKTTLGKAVCGLIQPDSGILLIDGHEIGQYDSATLRESIGYLPQDPDMFTGTILENITLGRPDASEAEIHRALYYSGMDYFISENPEGLKQFVGEKGNRLSGGQRQAISLARLILKRPKVLFLDEPTNAMDHTTETTIIERLSELNSEGTTLIVATHRHSLTPILNRLVVVDKGRKVMDGKREAVLKRLAMPKKGNA